MSDDGMQETIDEMASIGKILEQLGTLIKRCQALPQNAHYQAAVVALQQAAGELRAGRDEQDSRAKMISGASSGGVLAWTGNDRPSFPPVPLGENWSC